MLFKDFWFNDAIWGHKKFMKSQASSIKCLFNLKVNSLPLRILKEIGLFSSILPCIHLKNGKYRPSISLLVDLISNFAIKVICLSCSLHRFSFSFVLDFLNSVSLGSIVALPVLPVPSIFSILWSLLLVH